MSSRELKNLGISPSNRFNLAFSPRRLRSCSTDCPNLKNGQLENSTIDESLELLAAEFESEVNKDFESSPEISVFLEEQKSVQSHRKSGASLLDCGGNGGASLDQKYLPNSPLAIVFGSNPDSKLGANSWSPREQIISKELFSKDSVHSSSVGNGNVGHSISDSPNDPMAPVGRFAPRKNNQGFRPSRNIQFKRGRSSTMSSRGRGFSRPRRNWQGRGRFYRNQWDRSGDWDDSSFGESSGDYEYTRERRYSPRRRFQQRSYYNTGNRRGRSGHPNRSGYRRSYHEEDDRFFEERDHHYGYQRNNPRRRDYEWERSHKSYESAPVHRRQGYYYEGDNQFDSDEEEEGERYRRSYHNSPQRVRRENKERKNTFTDHSRRDPEVQNKNDDTQVMKGAGKKANKRNRKSKKSGKQPEKGTEPVAQEAEAEDNTKMVEGETSDPENDEFFGMEEAEVFVEKPLTPMQCRDTISQKLSQYHSRLGPLEKGKDRNSAQVAIDFILKELEETQSTVQKIQLQNEVLKVETAEGRLRAAEALRESRSNQILIFGLNFDYEQLRDPQALWKIIKEVMQKILKVKLLGPFKVMGHFQLPFEKDGSTIPAILVKFQGNNILENLLRRFQLKKVMKIFHSTTEGREKCYGITENLPKVLEDRRKCMEETLENMSMYEEFNKEDVRWTVSKNFGIRKATMEEGKLVDSYTFPYKKAIQQFKAYLPGADHIPI